jgi:ribosomal protein S18 acetylase RimI-like enzyme
MGSKLEIRKYLSGDAEPIIRLHAQSEESFEELDLTPEFIDHIARRDDFCFYVAVLEGELVGFCGALYYTSMGRSEIGPIAVNDKYRRAGVGKRLFEAAIACLKDRGIRRVTAKVKAANSCAIGFFTGAGFVEEGFFREYTRRKEDVFQYVKFI